MALFAEGGDWVWITMGATAIGGLIGVFGKTASDVIGAWFAAKAKAKVAEAEAVASTSKLRQEEEATAIGQWQALYEEAQRERQSLKEHVARQGAHIDELGRQVGELNAEHAECLVQNSELYGEHVLMHDFCVRCSVELEKHGISVGRVPPLAERRRRTREQRAASEFAARASAQNTTVLKAVTEEILKPKSEGSP